MNNLKMNSSNINTFPSILIQLQSIQELLKQEASLHNIIIKLQNQIYDELETIQANIIENKLKLKQNIEQINPELISLKKYYPESELFIAKFFSFLRMNQDLVYNILIKATTKEQMNILASLIVEFMYENILSSVSISNELLILIYRTLQYEINNLIDMNAPHLFLNEHSSINKYLFKHLITNTDIKAFILKLLNTINEQNYKINDSKKLYFNPEKIKELAKEQSRKGKEQQSVSSFSFFVDTNSNILNHNNNNNNAFSPDKDNSSNRNSETDSIFKLYLELGAKELNDIYNDQSDINMKDYIMKQLQDIDNNDLMYSNSVLLNQLYESEDATISLELYHGYLSTIINYMKGFINEINRHVTSAPVFIRRVSKIISLLIRKKFPKITKVNENAFIGRFLMEIFDLLFINPTKNGFLPLQIISPSTLYNMGILSTLIRQLFSGSFFKTEDNSNYTPFNCFFVQIMPQIFSFVEQFININLPKTLTDLINEEETNPQIFETFIFDYFKENPNEQVNNILICFSPEQLHTIIEIIKDHEDVLLSSKYENNFEEAFLKYKKSYTKLKGRERSEEIQYLLNNDKQQNKVSYSIINYRIFNKQLDLSTIKSDHFMLKELKSPQTEEEKIKNNIIKVKNALSEILYNIHLISIEDFFECKINTTLDFLNSLGDFICKGYYSLNDSIQMEWYIKLLKTLLAKLPDEYKKNDFNKLYEELKNDLELSINRIDYKIVAKFKDSLRYANQKSEHIEKSVKDFEQIQFMMKVNSFIHDFPIEVNLRKGKTNDTNIIFVEAKENHLYDAFNYFNVKVEDNKNKSSVSCKDINHFIKKFPNISASVRCCEIFERESRLQIPKVMSIYFQIVRFAIKEYDLNDFVEKDINSNTNISKNIKGNEQTEIKSKKKPLIPFLSQKEKVQNKTLLHHEEKFYIQITNYIMDRLYDKLFPKTPIPEDNEIYKQCHALSWIEIKHLTDTIKVDLESILPSTIGYISCMDKIRNPREKIKIFDKINDIISKTLSFLLGDKYDGGMDAHLPVMNYIIIKAMPKRFSSNIKYIEMFYDNIDNTTDKQKLVMISALKERLLDFNHKYVLNVSEEEYNRLCRNLTGDNVPMN